jgi:lipopolysaccharide/colanic/teichoic acid biosynthesis glycosyltransferase
MRRRVVIIGDTALASQFIVECRDTEHSGINIVGVMDESENAERVNAVPFLGSPTTLPDVINLYNIEGAVICNPTLSHQKLIDLIEHCVRLFGWVDVHSEKSAALQRSGGADAYFNIPFIRMHGISDNLLYESGKRLFDSVAALAGILILSPILIGTAIAIKITSPGPVFYTRDRVGQKGRPFPFYKFRSMAIDADQDEGRNEQIKAFIQNQQEGETLSKVVNTSYVTPVGRFIRKWAIDELPQLFNVLKGDMALVGPRPVPPSEYAHEDEWHQRRFSISPGCTGLWKLHATNEGVTFNDTVLYDIFYARNMNPAMDLTIIFSTIWVILKGKADG